jgi:hypothetical protein
LLGNEEYPLSVPNLIKDILIQVFTKFYYTFMMAGRTEVTTLTTVSKNEVKAKTEELEK